MRRAVGTSTARSTPGEVGAVCEILALRAHALSLDGLLGQQPDEYADGSEGISLSIDKLSVLVLFYR